MSYWLWDDYRRPVLPGLKVVSTVDGPMIPIETLRAQCEIVATDIDTDMVESHPDDTLILGYLDAAIEHAEDFTGLAIALRTYEIALDGFPWGSPWCSGAIEIPRAPLISVESFLAAAAGSEGELDEGDDYTVDDYRVPARILPVTSWPTMARSSNALKIRFMAGYSTPTYSDSDYAGAPPLPATIKQAILLLLGHFYANREDTVDKALASIPSGFNALLQLKRVRLGMA